MYAFYDNDVFLPTKEFYPLELDRWDFFNIEKKYFVHRCEAEHEFDPRYKDAGQGQLFYTEEHVQIKSGVLDTLRSLPQSSDYIDFNLKSQKKYSFWTRNTIPWKLECDESPDKRQEISDFV